MQPSHFRSWKQLFASGNVAPVLEIKVHINDQVAPKPTGLLPFNLQSSLLFLSLWSWLRREIRQNEVLAIVLQGNSCGILRRYIYATYHNGSRMLWCSERRYARTLYKAEGHSAWIAYMRFRSMTCLGQRQRGPSGNLPLSGDNFVYHGIPVIRQLRVLFLKPCGSYCNVAFREKGMIAVVATFGGNV